MLLGSVYFTAPMPWLILVQTAQIPGCLPIKPPVEIVGELRPQIVFQSSFSLSHLKHKSIDKTYNTNALVLRAAQEFLWRSPLSPPPASPLTPRLLRSRTKLKRPPCLKIFTSSRCADGEVQWMPPGSTRIRAGGGGGILPLRELFTPLRELFYPSVNCLPPSVNYCTPP